MGQILHSTKKLWSWPENWASEMRKAPDDLVPLFIFQAGHPVHPYYRQSPERMSFRRETY